MSKKKAVVVTEADRQKFRRLVNDGPHQGFPPYGPETEAEFEAQLRASINPRLLREGQEFFRRNFSAMLFSVFMSIFLGFGARSITGFLFRTGNLVQKDTMEIRSLRAYMYLLKWLEDDDFCSDNSPSLKFLAKVRRTHFHVVKRFGHKSLPEDEVRDRVTTMPGLLETGRAIQEDLSMLQKNGREDNFEAPRWDPEIPVSQFDMAMVQMGLMWCAPAAPQLIGIGDKTGFSGYLHLMEIVGRGCLVKDEFNVALHYTEGFEQLYVDHLYSLFCRQTDLVTTATRSVFHSISPGNHLLTFHAMTYLILSITYPIIGERRLESQLYGMCGWVDRLVIALFRQIFFLSAHISLVRITLNWIARKVLFARFENFFGPQETAATRRAKEYAAELDLEERAETGDSWIGPIEKFILHR